MKHFTKQLLGVSGVLLLLVLGASPGAFAQKKVVVDREAITVLEGLSTGQNLTVSLSEAPPSGETIRVNSSGHGSNTSLVLGSDDASFSSGLLTFNSDNWNTGITVAVTSPNEATPENEMADTEDGKGTLTFSALSGNFTDASVDVTIIDNDKPGIVVQPTLEVDEGGTGTLGVRLAANPGDGVTVSVRITGHSDSGLTLDEEVLTFDSSDFGDTKEVTVTAGTDENEADDKVTLTLNPGGGGGYDAASSQEVEVTIKDKGAAPRKSLVVNPDELKITEGGDAGTFTVRLSSEPEGDVTVTIGGHTGNFLTITPTSEILTFDADDFSTPQTVTVTAGTDENTVEDKVNLILRASGGGYSGLTNTVEVTIDDAQGRDIVVNPTLEITEGGEARNLMVNLSGVEPTGDVTVTIEGAGTLLTLDEEVLTFASGNYEEKQAVSVTAEPDENTVDDTVILRLRASGGGYSGLTKDVRVTIVDSQTEEARQWYVDETLDSGQIETCTRSTPCHPRVISGKALGPGDHVFARIRVTGGTATINHEFEIPAGHVTFSTYRPGTSGSTRGTLRLPQQVTIKSGGTFVRDNNLSVEFTRYTTANPPKVSVLVERSNTTVPFAIPDGPDGTQDQPDTAPDADLNFGPSGFSVQVLQVSNGVAYEKVTVKKGGTIRIIGTSRSSGAWERFTIENLEVAEGGTLIVGGGGGWLGNRRIDLNVPLKKGDDTKFQVDGLISGAYGGLVSLQPGSGSNVYTSEEYRSDSDKDGENCVRVAGKGEIRATIAASASGNVCIDLNKISGLLATDNSSSTDIIFTKDVSISGKVEQRGNARVHFEKAVTIGGNVELLGEGPSERDGTCSDTSRPSAYPGVQFAGEAEIKGRLILDHGGTNNNSTPDSVCRNQVSFLQPAGDGNNDVVLTSSVAKEIIVDRNGKISLGGSVYVKIENDEKDDDDKDIKVSRYVNRDDNSDILGNIDFDSDNPVISLAHNLEVSGDIYADAADVDIDMSGAALALTDAECRGDNDVQLGEGTRLTLAGKRQAIALGQGGETELMIETLVANGEVRVDGNGILKSTTLQVGPDGELESATDGNEIQVGDDENSGYLLLQGQGLNGELGAGSNVQYVTYASRGTDFVQLNQDNPVEAVTFDQGGTFETRLETPLTVKKLGLCSGELILVNTQVEDTYTLTVTEQITVRDGELKLDENEEGNFTTDYNKEGDKLKPAATDSYLLRYVNDGERTAGMEWDQPRDVVLGLGVGSDEPAPVITVEESKETKLHGKVHIFKGTLQVNSDLTVGASTIIPDTGRLLTIHNGELHSNGNDVVVHGEVTAGTNEREVAKIVTGDGNLHVLGNDENAAKDDDGSTDVNETEFDDPKKEGHYQANTAKVVVSAKSMIDVGDGTLQLGPAYTVKKDDLHANEKPDTRPEVSLSVERHRSNVGAVKGMIDVPKGSKRTTITGEAFDAIVMDGTRNDRKSSGTNTNWEGHLYLEANYDEKAKAGQNLAVDSVGVSNGGADFINKDAKKKVTINKDVAVSSASLYQETPTLEFKKDLAISGTGGFSSRHYDDFAIPAYRKKVTIGGDFSQETDQTEAPAEGWEHHPEGATYLSPKTDKTVTGSFTVSGKGTAERFGSAASTNLDVKGNFDFGLTAEDYVLNATLTFSGKEPQSVKTAATDLGSVDVKNAAGIVLESDVMQGKSSDLILTQGNISTAEKEDGSHYKWIVKNPGVEENLVGRPQVSLVEETAGNNPATIYRGSRQSFFLAPLVRHIAADGIDDEGKENGGYVFPTGALEEDSRFFRPLILQLAADLPEAVPATVYSESVPEDKTPAWPSENLLVPAGGGEFLTLNTYADIFWKVDFGASELAQNPNIRVAVEGIPNVYEPMGLRIVQWDCDWTNARLAGTYDFVESGDDDTEQSFVKNGWVAGVLNLTQRGVDLGGCSILGVASNGLENPIDQDAITSGVARIQFIHNLPILDPVDLYLDENVRIGNNLSFRSATGYGRFGAGAHELKVQPVGAPPESAIKQPLGSFANDSYYAVIVHGTLADPRIQVVRTKTESTTLVANEVSVLLVHGSAGLGAADIHVLDALDSNRPKSTLVRGFEFDTVTPRYRNLEPGYTNIQVKAGDAEEVYELDLNGYAGEIVILNLSGLGASDLEIYGVDENGGTVLSQVITNVEALEEIPTEFALHGNYPNPFNPSTRIQFDLPESAQVTVQIVDMLGREVMALPAKEFEAGANRSVELNAINLASGTYLYRMIATGAENRYVKTGRMTLVK